MKRTDKHVLYLLIIIFSYDIFNVNKCKMEYLFKIRRLQEIIVKLRILL